MNIMNMSIPLKEITRGKKLISNKLTSMKYREYLLDVVLSRFRWDSDIDELKNLTWYIEKSLAEHGCLGLTIHPETGKYLLLKASGVGTPTLHGDYTEYMLYGENGYTFTVKKEDVVILYNTLSRENIYGSLIVSYAERISDVQRTADIRMNNHKSPIILSGPRKMLDTFKLYLKRLIRNDEAIVITDDLKDNLKSSIQDIKYDAAFINNDLMTYKGHLFKEFFAMIGVNFNNETGKKERVNIPEVEANNEQIFRARYSAMLARETFSKQVKEKFGIDLHCKYVEPEKGGITNDGNGTDNNRTTDQESAE